MESPKNIAFRLRAAGGPFHDPALLVTPANSRDSLLFDCGTLHSLKTRDLLKVRWLFLSHLHIDHLIGFDHLLRVRLFSDLPLTVYGPPGTTETIGHRLLGYTWNLTSGSPFVIETVDLAAGAMVEGSRFACNSQFQQQSTKPAIQFTDEQTFLLEQNLEVSWHPVEHGVPCYCYRLSRTYPPKFSPENCHSLGLSPGPWVRDLTRGVDLTMEVDGMVRDTAWLSRHLLSEAPQQSLGYLTDSKLETPLAVSLGTFFQGVNILACESAYLAEEESLAKQNLHMTTNQVGILAKQAMVDQLYVFHFSRRYAESGPDRHLQEVRNHFPQTDLLPH
jgi:ribonuclease Z